MKYAAAALALAAGASASYAVANTTAPSYTTEVVTSYETYCPGPTTLTYGTQTYEVTEPTTLTITDCTLTLTYPVYTTSSVICHACSSAPPPVYPTTSYPNTTVATTTYYPTTTLPTSYPTVIPTAAAGKVVAGMAGVLAAVAAAL